MIGWDSGLGQVLAVADDAAPVASVDVVARNLRERVDATAVSFLFGGSCG